MKEVEIFVEGTSDRLFLAAYLEQVFGLEMLVANKKDREKERTYQFNGEQVKGYISLLHDYKKVTGQVFQSSLEYNNKNDITTLLLLDADTTKDIAGHTGGVKKRKAWLGTVTNIESCYPFLVPNNKEDGYLETILKNIITAPYQAVLTCLEQQEGCLQTAAQQLPVGEELVLKPSNIAEKKRMKYLKEIIKGDSRYKNATIWNLQNSYLDELKKFLQIHLQITP